MAYVACKECAEPDGVEVSKYDDPPVTTECCYCGALHESHTYAASGRLYNNLTLVEPVEEAR